jgi:hypothetical protein
VDVRGGIAWGAAIEVREHTSLPRVIAARAECGLLGLLFIGLKSLFH